MIHMNITFQWMGDGVSMATGRRALVEYVEWESNIATEPVQILNL